MKNYNRDSMKQITKCPRCGKSEYVGMLHWRDGKMYCRHCIEHLWNKEANTIGKSQHQYYFPLYSDGINYTIENRDKS
jgi:late competence protein required for DNA uptake (superfamily II DNA/RNA helicase)